MSRHRASSMVNVYGLNYCADHTNGNVYEYSLDIYTDNGDPIIKQRDTAVIHGGLFGAPSKKLNFNKVTFNIVSGYTDLSGTGQGALPAVVNSIEVELGTTVVLHADLASTVQFEIG